MEATRLADDIWGQIYQAIESGKGGPGWRQGVVTGRDEQKRVVWVAEMGTDPIEVVGHENDLTYYAAGNRYVTKIPPAVPEIGEVVVLSKSMVGDWHCVGVLQSTRTWKASGGIGMLPEDSVTQRELAPNSVGPDELQANSVGNSELQDAIVTETELAQTVKDVFVPIGGMVPYAGSGDPAGGRWLLADGRLIDRTVYASFFTQVGHAYNGGVDPGSNMVRIPDKRGRTSVGADNMGTATGAASRVTVGPNARGQGSGAERIALVLGETPPHSHTVNAHNHGGGNHSHRQDFHPNTSVGGSGFNIADVAAQANQQGYTSGTIIGTESPGTNAQGGGASHQNMPPYEVDNWIVRVS